MTRDPRYDILFQPLAIGPVVAKNRFYQVPHCNGMGSRYGRSMAAMRVMKAEGGWAVVCTEETEIHPSSDMSPVIEGRFWDDRDIPTFARMTEALHDHGALAGIQLSHMGHRDACLYSRDIPLSVTARPVLAGDYPAQARQMDLSDIRNYRKWCRDAALRAKKAGFDIVYVYCRASASLNGMFLSRVLNQRSDEYGGSLENRVRLVREVLQETKEAVGDSCAVAIRYTVDEWTSAEGDTDPAESREIVEMLAEIPDLWDVNIREWRRDSVPSRFGEEGSQEDLVAFVKSITTKPVVGVGRFTSPDAMVSQIKRGVLDFIGAARPSIADPFLPRKVEEGRLDEIRECIGCNICVSADSTMVPLRCTQNPTMGEEWRKGWHPEIVPPKRNDDRVLIVGAGPAGLECALTLTKRGQEVILAEATEEFGGRVAREAKLPGLAAWGRVRDHRLNLLQTAVTCELYAQSEMTAETVLELGCERVVLACGAHWRRDGLGRHHERPLSFAEGTAIFTPDDIMADATLPTGPVLIYDDDHYYMGGVLAELLRARGLEVVLVTPAFDVSAWTQATLEQSWVEQRLHDLGVRVVEKHLLCSADETSATLRHLAADGRREKIDCGALVLVTSRAPRDELYHELMDKGPALEDAGIRSVTRIGDCLAPSTIAAAVYAGHRYARELGEDLPEHDRRDDI